MRKEPACKGSCNCYFCEMLMLQKNNLFLLCAAFALLFTSCDSLFNNEEEKYYVDRNALVGSVQDPQVFVVEDSVARLRNIVIGEIHNDLIQVVSGLGQDDQVVVSGQINLSEGTRVNLLD